MCEILISTEEKHIPECYLSVPPNTFPQGVALRAHTQSIPELIQLNPLQAWKTASTALSWCVSHPDGPNAFPSLISSLSQTLPSGYDHRSTPSWKEGAGFFPWSQEFLVRAPQQEVGSEKDCPCVLPLSKFSFLLFHPTGRRQRTGSLSYLQSAGRTKEVDAALRWHVTVLYFRKKTHLVFSLQNCAKEFSWFLPCKLPLTLVIQKFVFWNPVPWLYASSSHCTVCLHWDWFYIEEVSLKSKPYGNERMIDIMLQWTAPLMHQNENLCVILSRCILDIFKCCFTSVCQCYEPAGNPGSSSSGPSFCTLSASQAHQFRLSTEYSHPCSFQTAQDASRENLYLPEKCCVDNTSEPLEVKFALVGCVGTFWPTPKGACFLILLFPYF